MKKLLSRAIIFGSSMMFLFSCSQEVSTTRPQSSEQTSLSSSVHELSQTSLTMKSNVYGHYWVDENNNRVMEGGHDFDIEEDTPSREHQEGSQTYTCRVCGYTFDKILRFDGIELSPTTPLSSIEDEFDKGFYDFTIDWIPRMNDEDWGDFYKTRYQSDHLFLRGDTAALVVDFIAPVEGFNTQINFTMYEEDGKTYVVRNQKHTYHRDTNTWEFHEEKVVDYYCYNASVKEVALAYTRYDEINSSAFDIVNGELTLKTTETENGIRTRSGLSFNQTELSYTMTTDKNETAMVKISHLGMEKKIVITDRYHSFKEQSELRELPLNGKAFSLY